MTVAGELRKIKRLLELQTNIMIESSNMDEKKKEQFRAFYRDLTVKKDE